MADVLVCQRCGRRWPVSWRDRPGWLCRNTAPDPPGGRPCMGALTLDGAEGPAIPSAPPPS